ncbi:hypothetical protein [Pedobacter alluvionis]|uniref:Uncharacterized protein n=1 Tax=Pedobacter alluvionis TaxID=475253 RepID=A0A497Y5G9_9SPHI|nr:hypothetical protein [Pedobacter alluvionis]RLJ77216.1 hypothetical protein BCL90_2295 [Pedobacter alluvionis]TFB33556.1 hypothetical protein E3V97_05775 [Pedobacter alluvionis]
MKKRIILQPQMIKIVSSFLGILTLLFCINACRKTSSDSANEYGKNDFVTKTHTIDYNANVTDSILHFKIKIYEKNANSKQIDETFDVDIRKNSFNKNIANILKEKSRKDEYNKLNSEEVRAICNAIKEMITSIIKPLSPDEIKSPKIQGLYLSLSFVRRLLNNESGLPINLADNMLPKKVLSSNGNPFDAPSQIPHLYEQDVYEGTTIGLSPFILNEDIIVNKEALLLVISQDIVSMNEDNKGLYVFQEVLNNILQPTFTLKDFLKEIDTYRALHPELIDNIGGWWPSGSDHGCCGNYVGACKFWHPICYIHDKICKRCTPKWFCLGGCIPDKNSIEFGPQPFTLIEDLSTEPEQPGESAVLTIPVPLPDVIYYTTDLTIIGTGSVPYHATTIFYNPLDKKYYSDAAFQNLLQSAYYILPNDYSSGKYYSIFDGKVVLIDYASNN